MSLQEKNNKPSAPEDASVDEVTRQGHQLRNAARREDKDSSARESRGRASEEVGPSDQAEDEGSVLTKLRKMVSKPLSHVPSLALDGPVSVDGVLRRPCENGVEDGRDPSPDRNDSDSISAYEDASAETPEQDRMFPGDADTLELPDDSENKERSLTNNCQINDGETQDPRNPDMCVVS